MSHVTEDGDRSLRVLEDGVLRKMFDSRIPRKIFEDGVLRKMFDSRIPRKIFEDRVLLRKIHDQYLFV